MNSDSGGMNRRYSTSDKYIFRASATVVVILALASGILSYSALQSLAVMSGIPPILSFLFPIVIDGLILSGTLLVLYFAIRGRRTVFGIFLTLLGVIASIAGNVAVSDDNIVHQVVHGAPALVLFLSLEALTILLRSRYKENREMEEEEAQRRTEEEQAQKTPETAQDAPVEAQNVSGGSTVPTTLTSPPTGVEEQDRVEWNPVDSPEPAPESDSSSLSMPEETVHAPRRTVPAVMPETPVETVEAPVSPSAPVTSPAPAVAPLEPHRAVSEPVRAVSEPAQDSVSTEKQNPASGKVQDDTDYVVIEGSKREQIVSLIQQNPRIRPKTVTEVLGGDRSYNSKLLKEVRDELESQRLEAGTTA